MCCLFVGGFRWIVSEDINAKLENLYTQNTRTTVNTNSTSSLLELVLFSTQAISSQSLKARAVFLSTLTKRQIPIIQSFNNIY